MDVTCVHRVFLAQVVGLDAGGLVDGLLAVKHSSASEAVVEQAEVEFRADVLRGEEVQVVRFLGFRAEQGAVIAQFGVRGLAVVERCGPGGQAPRLQGIVELHAFVALALEPVVVLNRGSGHSQPAGIHVVALERMVVEMVVEAGVRHGRPDGAEVLVHSPGNEPLVLHRVGDGIGLQYARSGFEYAVLDFLLALLVLAQGIRPCPERLGLLLIVVFLPFLFGEPVVPGFEGSLCLCGGIGDVDGIDLVPEG